MSEELRSTIKSVRETIEKHRPLLKVSEGSTRYSLVDPVLRALGWSLQNLDEAIAECPPSYPQLDRLEHMRIDYVLFGKSTTFVEVKRLGYFNVRTRRVSNRIQGQLRGYCKKAWKNPEGLRPVHLLTTDGNVWAMFQVDKICMSHFAYEHWVSVTNSNIDDCTQTLNEWLRRATSG